MLSILPRFVALEMIADMSSLENELNPQEFHKISIHQYKNVRYRHTHTVLRFLGVFFIIDCHLFQMAKQISNQPSLVFTRRQQSNRNLRHNLNMLPFFCRFSLKHPFRRHQGLHSFVHEPVCPGSGSNSQRALWTL